MSTPDPSPLVPAEPHGPAAPTYPDHRLIFRSVPGLYLVLDPQLRLVDASDAYLAATLTHRDEIVGRHLFEVFPDNPADGTADGVANLRASLERVIGERRADTMAVQKYDIRRPESADGEFEVRYWSPRNSPVLSPDGDLLYLLHQVEDVTEFVRLRQADREREAAHLQLTHRTSAMEAEIYRAAQEIQVANQELREANQRLEREAAEHRRTADALAASLEQLRLVSQARAGAFERRIREQSAILDQARDAILVCELDGRISYWNLGAERLYGWSAADSLGRRVQDLIHPSPEAFVAALAAAVASGDWQGELAQRHRGGIELAVDCHLSLLRDDDGTARSLLAINSDVTAKRRIEVQLLRAQRLESIGTLAGGIAHDLNNILTPIIMGIGMLRRTVPDGTQRILDIIDASAHRGAEMVQQVLSFARGVDGRNVEIDLRALCRDLEQLIGEMFPKTIHTEIEVAADVPGAIGDPTQLHQVLLNLCVNARDAMPNGGQLRITASRVVLDAAYVAMNRDARPGPHVRLEVADTGSGIEPAVLERIFDPFFTTKGVGEGTGLGLSTSLAIVKRHGGFITVYSERGRGTRFNVYLPARDDDQRGARGEAPAVDLRGHGELILLVDDESAVRLVASETLEAFDYRVVTASDGAEAVAVYVQRAAEIALVITDMAMPIMDGTALIRALTRIHPAVRIIGTSGLANHAAVGDMPGRVATFLAKPYTADTLLRAIQNQLATAV